jgi:hypothetical protein
MTDEQRSLREHLADERLYAGAAPAPAAHPAAWRAALLARYPEPARARRPLSRAKDWRRLVLLVALPLAGAVAIAALAAAGLDFETLPAQSWAPLGEAIRRLAAEPLQAPRFVWFGLAGLSAALTLIVRGRVPRLLPVNW